MDLIRAASFELKQQDIDFYRPVSHKIILQEQEKQDVKRCEYQIR